VAPTRYNFFAMSPPRPTPEAALERFLDPARDPLPLVAGLVDAVRPHPIDDAAAAARNYAAVLAQMRARPELVTAMRDHFLELFATRKLTSFFTDAGILPATGFFSELARRVSHRLLPEALDERSLRDCVRLVFHTRDSLWLRAIPPELSREFWSLLSLSRQQGRHLSRAVKELLDAMQILSHRISAMGIEPELLRVVPRLDAFESPFLAQTDEAHRIVAAWRAHGEDGAPAAHDSRQLLVLLDQCREVLKRARRTAAREGTSLGLTYLLYRLAQSLDRLEMLVQILEARQEAAPDQAVLSRWNDFFRATVRAECYRNSIGGHVSRMMGLLALRVTDHAGRTGEHYITTDWAGYRDMWRSAMGAGFIIAFMALLKIYATRLGLAPLNQAFVFSMNYALGFVLIHMLHFTVATKQPAMTAATIAGAVSESQERGDLGRLADLIVDVLRSQFAAILGNVAIAFPTAVALAYGVAALTGQPFLDAAKAHHLLHDIDPLASLAIPHAAIAGVCLFLSGLISGYFDNRAAYARIPERVARLPWLRSLAGIERARRCGDWVGENLGGLAGNFCFGIMLGSMGTLGLLVGLPLDIRHIAFASANFAYALVALDFAVPWQGVLWGAIGVALIGLTNLLVSFTLALWVALKARDAVFGRTRELLRLLSRRFADAPARFFVPPPDRAAAAE
jgi:site-specific recombinase